MPAPTLPLDEHERLAALGAIGILDTPPEERFDRVTRLCRRLFHVDLAFVNLVDRDRQWTKSCAGGDGGAPVVSRNDSFCGHAILRDDPLIVSDALGDERFLDNPYVVGDPNIRFYAGVPIAAPGGHHVGTLCIADSRPRDLDPADVSILRDLALWVEKELNLSEELDRAAEVQRALLPARPPEDPGWDVAGFCRPSRDVGGDFYDWHTGSGGTVVTLADVMGKGMPAAIVSASVRAAIRSGAAHAHPGAALGHAADSLAGDLLATGTFATAFVASLGDDGTVAFADAGHGQAAVIRGDGTVEELPGGGLPVGIEIGERYEDLRTTLAPGELLVVHSDGLLETAHGPRSTSALAALLVGVDSAEAALRRVSALVGPGSPPDDVTVLVVRRRG